MKVIKGDLIKLAQQGEFHIIIHGCNCFHTMGAGIARQIKVNFPEAYTKDCHTIYGDKDKLGSFSSALVNVIRNNKPGYMSVVNAYTQYFFGTEAPYCDYEAIRKVMKSIKETYGGAGLRIGYPKIGAGLAGGDWNIISQIIDEELEGEDHTLVVLDR